VQAINLVQRNDGMQSQFGEVAAKKEGIAHVDGVVPVGSGGVDGVVIAVLIVVEKGIVHIARERGGSIAEQDRVRRVVRSRRSHRR
jgi:ribosomal protein S9